MKTNLLHTIPLKKALTFEVRIGKGAFSNFSKFQLQVPTGVTVKEVNSKEGTFSFEEDKAKIIWVVTPADSIISVRMKIAPVLEPLSGNFVFKYYYMADDDKREFEAVPFSITFKDTVLPVFLSAPMTVLRDKSRPVLPPVPDSAMVVKSGPVRISQQVQQLRKDSREAFTVGEREKQKAERQLDSLTEAAKAIETITNEEEKKSAEEKHEVEKQKVKENLAVAERVLTLAKTLDQQAVEIEKINEKIKTTNNKGSAATARSKGEKKAGIPAAQNHAGTAVLKVPAIEKQKISTIGVEPGLIYKVQVGAFREKPISNQFHNLGNVTVVSENGIYKVLVGSYSSKEEANQLKEQLVKQSMDCFVVGYQDGIRIK
jgi:cell division protein FtsN